VHSLLAVGATASESTLARLFGALMEHLEHDVLNQLQGANITLERGIARPIRTSLCSARHEPDARTAKKLIS